MSGESNNSEMRAIRSRLDFSKIPTSIQIPNLIEVQRRSYERFAVFIGIAAVCTRSL